MLDNNEHIGIHVIADLYEIPKDYLTNLKFIEDLLHKAAKEAEATPIVGNFHHFGENFGITGVLLLKESHISIHTWPELSFAAIDIFMCGHCMPEKSIEVLKLKMKPARIDIKRIDRGSAKFLSFATNVVEL